MNRKHLNLRHEKKYLISALESHLLKTKLSKVLMQDDHANSQGTYSVSSLYFDTPEDRALREKLEGVSPREKYRIRTYGKEFSFFKLERKRKLHGLTKKDALPLNLEEVEPLLEGKSSFLLDKKEALVRDFYIKLKNQRLVPKVVVIYEREAFLYGPGNVRITLDSHVRTGPPHLFLKRDASFIPTMEQGVVLEVKYDQFLPDLIRALLQVPQVSQTAFSKYAHSRLYD